MKRSFALTALALAAACASGSAWAVITCSVASAGVTASGSPVPYVPSTATTNVTTANFTVTCQRTLAGDATTQAYTVKASNGLYSSGQNNRAASGANRITYDVYTNNTCATQWRSNATIGGNVTFTGTSDFSPRTATSIFYGCIPGSQTTVPAGTYSDTVVMTLSPGASTAAFPVSIITPSSCSITTAPGNITFNYTSFNSSVLTPSTTFATTCTSQLPYTMALDLPTGTSLGLNYSLALSAGSGMGTGLAQSYSINGTMAASQAGTCALSSCNATQARTITITY